MPKFKSIGLYNILALTKKLSVGDIPTLKNVFIKVSLQPS